MLCCLSLRLDGGNTIVLHNLLCTYTVSEIRRWEHHCATQFICTYTEGGMSFDLMLKACCDLCGSPNELYGSNCKHMTLCVKCGKLMVERKDKCRDCGVTVTRHIRGTSSITKYFHGLNQLNASSEALDEKSVLEGIESRPASHQFERGAEEISIIHDLSSFDRFENACKDEASGDIAGEDLILTSGTESCSTSKQNEQQSRYPEKETKLMHSNDEIRSFNPKRKATKEKVRAILFDPSCYGSGTVADRLDHLLPSHILQKEMRVPSAKRK
ncbi:hypothetical protein Tco_1403565 [Tanacetum coccineum]